MSIILAIETSSELASVALLQGTLLVSRQSSGVQTHSQSILPMVQEVLTQAGIALKQCDALAFGAGPGSFTGVRTACGVVQGLAFGAELPVVPVMTLAAMAHACRELSGATEVLTILDARMGEVYWAQYRYLDGWHTVIAPQLSAPAAVQPQGAVVACGNGVSAYADAFARQPFSRQAQSDVMPHACQVAQLAQIAFSQGHILAAADAQPFYLRNKVALTVNERLQKTVVSA